MANKLDRQRFENLRNYGSCNSNVVPYGACDHVDNASGIHHYMAEVFSGMRLDISVSTGATNSHLLVNDHPFFVLPNDMAPNDWLSNSNG